MPKMFRNFFIGQNPQFIGSKLPQLHTIAGQNGNSIEFLHLMASIIFCSTGDCTVGRRAKISLPMSTVSMAGEGSFHGQWAWFWIAGGVGGVGWVSSHGLILALLLGVLSMAGGPYFGTVLALLLGIKTLTLGTHFGTFRCLLGEPKVWSNTTKSVVFP